MANLSHSCDSKSTINQRVCSLQFSALATLSPRVQQALPASLVFSSCFGFILNPLLLLARGFTRLDEPRRKLIIPEWRTQWN